MNKQKIVTVAVMAVATMMAAMMLSCGHQQQNELKQTMADSLFDAAFIACDYERVLALCDSLEHRGDISMFRAALERGWAYHYLGKPKAKEKELRQALLEKPENTDDSLLYFNAAVQLTFSRSVTGDYNEALEVALPALESLQKMYRENPSERVANQLIDLMIEAGKIQMALGMKEEADKMFEESYNYEKKSPLDAPVAYAKRFWRIDKYIVSYINANDMVSVEKWLIRQDSMTAMIREGRGLVPADSDKIMASSYLNHASIAAVLNRQEEFNRAVAAYKTTQMAKTPTGKVGLASALLEARHYAEAADEYAALDQNIAESGMEPSLDNLCWYEEKFKANYKAGRRDTALTVANFIIENLDSAITRQKKSDAAELATIY